MMSAESFTVIKVAAIICSTKELKQEILCVPGSESSGKSKKVINKGRWTEIIERRTGGILKCLELPKSLQEKIMGAVVVLGMKMLIWTLYHERFFEISRQYIAGVLNTSFITQNGTIDNRKVAEELMNDKFLSITQKYKLAAQYCLTDHIPMLYGQLKENEKETFRNSESLSGIKQSGLVRFWTYYIGGDVDNLLRNEIMEVYVLGQAIKDGSLATVQYFFEKIVSRHGNGIVLVAALKAVSFLKWQEHLDLYTGVLENDSWIPTDSCMDIVCFLLSRMTEDQQVDFLERDIYSRVLFEHSWVLKSFLNSPYQKNFLNTAERMWQFLPEDNFYMLLILMIEKIEAEKDEFSYGEGKSFDYRKLLREFWLRSNGHYKRFVLNGNVAWGYKTFFPRNVNVCLNRRAGAGLLIGLLSLKNFTYEDRDNIRLILASASDSEKDSIFRSIGWIEFCCFCIRKERWDLLNRIVLSCFPSQENSNIFKRHLSSTPQAKRCCADLLKSWQCTAVESFMMWCGFSEDEKMAWKLALVFSTSESLCTEFATGLQFRHSSRKLCYQKKNRSKKLKLSARALKRQIFLQEFALVYELGSE